MGKKNIPPMAGKHKYNAEGMINCPPGTPEGWFRKTMARREEVNVNGQEFELQSVSPRWYLEQNDRCGMTGSSKDTARYMDIMFKNVVISPSELATAGLKYFDDKEDIETPELLIREIERFFRPGKRSEGSKAASSE